jgi:transcriptional regulator with XRE-family HTH domain
MLEFLSHTDAMPARRPPPAPQPATPGGRISALRRACGMTQDELATACGVSRSAVAQWETDRAGQLRENLPRIAKALDVSVEMLVTGGNQDGALLGDELALVRLYRACTAEDRAFLLRTARKLANIQKS